MRHPKRSAALRIEIRIEHAAPAAELELKATPLPDLERGLAEMAHQFIGSEAAELASHLGRWRWRRRGLRHLLARRAHAGCKQKGGSKGE